MNKFMKIAINEANIGLDNSYGGPFGAVIICDNKVISKAHNLVLKTNDPTAHAEINAIRKACKKLKKFDLSDCELYTTCMPCPMCLSAIYWARIKKVYFGASSNDAKKIGFIDEKLYDILNGKKKSTIKLFEVNKVECVNMMKRFANDVNKKLY